MRRIRPGVLIAIAFAALVAVLIVVNGIHPRDDPPRIIGGPSSASVPTAVDPNAPLRLPAAVGTLAIDRDPAGRQLAEESFSQFVVQLGLPKPKIIGVYLDPTYHRSAGRYIAVAGTYADAGADRSQVTIADPDAMIATALDNPQISNAQAFDPGARGGALRCGDFYAGTLCIWADSTVEVAVAFVGSSSVAVALDDVTTMREIRAAVER